MTPVQVYLHSCVANARQQLELAKVDLAQAALAHRIAEINHQSAITMALNAGVTYTDLGPLSTCPHPTY